MAIRAKTTFQKRQKELARKDKQQRKAERRELRKLSRAQADRIPAQDDAFPAGTQHDRSGVVSRHRTVDS
jgi:hypothetical protein